MNPFLVQFRRLIAALALGCVAGAQPMIEPPAPGAPAAGRETEGETVARCLAEMASPDVQARRRAILVLGKYENPQAEVALLQALRDEDALVRQSALVSFSERRGIPQAANEAILGLLADPDVHVRRIASSMLPELLLRARFGIGGADPRVVDTLAPRPTPANPGLDRTTQRLNAALGDADATVVKNVLTAVGMLPGALDLDKVLACLANPDREVRVLALQTIQRSPVRREQALADQLAPLAKDDDDTVRREVAGALARCGAAGLPALRVLAADPVPAVRLEASRQLVLLQDESAPAILAKLLVDPTVDADARAQLVSHLLLFDGPVGELLRQLATAGATPVRAAAIRTLGNRRLADQAPPAAFFLALLDDPQLAVRQASASALLSVAPRLGEGETQRFLRSKHPDVRQAGLARARLLPPKQAQEILLEACLDDDLDVRCAALMQLALTRCPDWEEILAQSLQDPDPRVRETALNGLGLGRSEKAVAHLLEFLRTCDDPALADQVRRLIARTQRQPGAVPLPLRPPVRPGGAPNP